MGKRGLIKKRIVCLSEIVLIIMGMVAFSVMISPEKVVVSAQEVPSNSDLGCCFDSDEGLCDPFSLQTDCEERENSKWFESKPMCEVDNVNECRLGCCSIGLDKQFVTQTRCNKLSDLYGQVSSWDGSITDEASCVALAGGEKEGACVFEQEFEEENLCSFTTNVECQSLGGNFYEGKLCSNPELDTVCEKQSSVSCVDGRDGVYWFDSCGNLENIYSSNKDASWNNGEVLGKEQSCNPNDSNANSVSCGNCDYDLGSICGEFESGDKGNFEGYTCKDLNCYDAPDNNNAENDRVNGESWCVYDGATGPGLGVLGLISRDTVGSRHFKYSCINGEVEVEPCADYRKEICVQDSKEGKDSALCRPNLWEQCIGLNNGENGCEGGCLAQCLINPDCRIQNVNVDENFKFFTCVPKYPPGFELGGGLSEITSALSGNSEGDIFNQLGGLAGGSDSGGICSLASKTCTSTWVKMCPGGWTCVDNCECHESTFTTQLSNLCVSLGDCGIYTNWVGTPSLGNAHVKKDGDHGKTPIQPVFLVPIYFILGNVQKFLINIIPGDFAKPQGYDSVSKIANLPFSLFDPFVQGYNSFGDTGQAESGFLGGLFSGDQLGSTIGLTAAGGAAGAGIGGATIGGATGLLGGAAIGAAIVIGILTALGCGKTETVDISYECGTWQRPIIGQCEKCTEDPYKPCSKYRCESLGATCQIINEDTGFAECVSIESEVGAPLISPWEYILNKTQFRYQTISNNGFEIRDKDGECIQAFTPLLFGVKTDVHAKCKISESRDFENSTWSYFFEGELYTLNHSYTTYLPSVDSLLASEVNNYEELEEFRNTIITSENIDNIPNIPGVENDISEFEGQTVGTYLLNKVGDIDLYVKCEGINGQENENDYKINFCVDPGPDRTLPVITATSPPSGSQIAFNSTNQDVTIYVNEPVECRWDVVNPQLTNAAEAYQSLNNEFECEQEVNSGTLLGYPCEANLPISESNSTYYFLCRDQPWLGNNESRNYGAERGNVFEYTLAKSEFNLEIDSIIPNGEITGGSEPFTVDVEVKTSKGVENGKSVCEFNLNDLTNSSFIRFVETNSNTHKQSLSLNKGDYVLDVKCIDSAGNYARNESSFSLELDTQFPEITRVFNLGADLAILTNEPATCYYAEDAPGCNFNSINTTEMNGGGTTIHSTTWDPSNVHYVLCEDIWKNKPSSCSIIVKPDDFIR